jgi:hypothetical protein
MSFEKLRRVVFYKLTDVLLFTLIMEAKSASEISVHFYHPIPRHIQE